MTGRTDTPSYRCVSVDESHYLERDEKNHIRLFNKDGFVRHVGAGLEVQLAYLLFAKVYPTSETGTPGDVTRASLLEANAKQAQHIFEQNHDIAELQRDLGLERESHTVTKRMLESAVEHSSAIEAMHFCYHCGDDAEPVLKHGCAYSGCPLTLRGNK